MCFVNVFPYLLFIYIMSVDTYILCQLTHKHPAKMVLQYEKYDKCRDWEYVAQG